VSRPHACAGADGIVTVTLEDHGQDFLEWDIDLKTMQVIECRPFQGFLWNATKVGNSVLRVGDVLRIKTKHSNKWTRLLYPIASVSKVSSVPLLEAASG
jgi:hypothetical protein